MKSVREVDDFRERAAREVGACPECSGSLENTECACVRKYMFSVEAFEACVPRDFWLVKPSDIEYNREAFDTFVAPYVRRLSRAQRNGYGLLFSGSNGVGKTMFMSYVLTCAIRRGRSAYYTTMLNLDHDFKRGFEDPEARERLEFMLSSDFLGLDEMGKEQFKAIDKPNFIKTQIERILKQRFDESKPVLLATNLSKSALAATYGDTIMSIIKGKYQPVAMEPGDIRAKLAKRMADDMGYGE